LTAEVPRTPITVLTGFLGAGKTTVLNRLLGETRGLRVAVIENELGQIGLDGDLITTTTEELVMLTGGCACCTVRGDIVRVLRSWRQERRQFDHIIIETTGIADPRPLISTLLIEQHDDQYLAFDGVVTVVDALNIHGQMTEHCEVREQLASADRVVISKLDLVPTERGSVESLIADINPYARVVDASDALTVGAVSRDPLEINPRSLPVFTTTNGAHSRHPRGMLVARSVELAGELNPARFYRWWGDFLFFNRRSVLRIKAFLAIAGSGRRVNMQGVQDLIRCSLGPPWGDDEPFSRVVVIGYRIDQAELEGGLRGCLQAQS
jgi:G3E family GTPase